MKINKNKIEICIARKQTTISELSILCGLAQHSLSTMLNRGSCSLKTAGKIAGALGVDVTEIIETEGDKTNGKEKPKS